MDDDADTVEGIKADKASLVVSSIFCFSCS
jgi:hypothetical protein